MSEVATLIADMVRAGVDPELIGRTAEVLAEQNGPAALTARQARNRRYYERKASEKRLNASYSDVSDAPSPEVSPEVSPTPPSFPLPNPNPIPPSPPKGGSSPAEIDAAFAAFASMARAAGIPEPRVINDQRRRKMGGLIRTEGMPRVIEAIEAIGSSDFCRGRNDRGWTADLDFLLQAKSFAGLLEGKYANRKGQAPPHRIDPVTEAAHRLMAKMEAADASSPAKIESDYPAPFRLSATG